MGNMRFKVGDRVRIKSLDWYNKYKDEDGDVSCRGFDFVEGMKKFCSETLTISEDAGDGYLMLEDKGGYVWTEEMIEGLVEDKALKQYEVPTGSIKIWDLPDGCQFKDENGNVINATKIVLEKKKKEYPKTYYECTMFALEGAGYKRALLLVKLEKLLTCRDAYWKIAGEEMGLGKPWEPDWLDDDTKKYVITSTKVFETFGGLGYINYILTFPTKEMRDAFYENFKELIESCKELL